MSSSVSKDPRIPKKRRCSHIVLHPAPACRSKFLAEATIRKKTLDLAKGTAALSDEDATKTIAKWHAKQTWVLTARWRKLLRRAYGESYGDVLDQATLPHPYVLKWSSPLYDSLPAAEVNVNTVNKANSSTALAVNVKIAF